MTLRIEYEGIVLAKVKVPAAVTADKTDQTVNQIATSALGRIDTRVLNWNEPVYISIQRGDSGEGCQVNVRDFIDIDTGEPYVRN